MSFRLVPANAQSSQDAHVVSTQATAHAISGTHDTFRYGLKSAAQGVAPANVSPLQARLEKASWWKQTQLELQQNMQRTTFGLAVPMKQAMEMKLVSEASLNLHNPLLDQATPSGLPLGGGHNIALEILEGRDESIDADEFMGGGINFGEVLDVNGALERKRGI
ncbi:hypothetical protein I350_02190 [Cryptococcus amylolentus CBS 6273]|uniref:Proteasome maturation factor UMP1 n=1 Tax=Cryptococcus amylolentus CBS 6273 TaxID=1296118 RepID=A0A1E3KAF9_9TREE|nr:hypothetical protein I350_02190 [Cryptococcus amylolentus CBS 6273]